MPKEPKAPREQWVGVRDAALRIGLSEKSIRDAIPKGCPCRRIKRKNKPGVAKILLPLIEASEWLAANGYKVGVQSIPVTSYETPAPGPEEEPIAPPPPAPPGAAGTEKPITSADLGYFASVERMKRAEIACFNDYVRAKQTRNLGLTLAAFRNWSEAQRRLRDAEVDTMTLETLQKKANEEASRALREWCEPLKVFLEGMPRILANQLNPGDPAFCEKGLRNWLNTQLLPIMSRKHEPSL